MKHAKERERFERFLRSRSLKLTPQRARVFDRAFETEEHFSAERLYDWLREEGGDGSSAVSRATVYRTLQLLLEGGFVESLDTGRGEVVYEHTLGVSHHHDHMVCIECGRIEEFHDERIEELQQDACTAKGFELVRHTLRLMGYCPECRKARAREAGKARSSSAQPR